MEFAANIHHYQEVHSSLPPLPAEATNGSPWEPFAQSWEWTDLDQELLEEFERHEQSLNDPLRS
jgi:hypothetical protein